MFLKRLITLLYVLPILYVNAQTTTFATQGLERLAECVGIKDLNSLSTGTHYIYTYKGHKLTVRVNEWKEVEHIGLLLFSQEARRLHPLPVYDFLERYLLAQNAFPSDSDEQFLMDWDKVHYTKGNAETAMKLDTTATFSESHANLKVYKVSWNTGDIVVLEMSFYMDYQLLTGCNTLELESSLFKKLRRVQNNARLYQKIGIHADGTEYTKKGKHFISSYVRNDIYYTREKSDGEWMLVTDSNRMVKTLSNIMIAENSDHEMKVKIKMDRYGLRADSAIVDYKAWRQLCLDEGCVPYFGLKSKQEDTYKCSVFMVNETCGYLHLLSIDVPTKTIMNPEKALAQARLYCYIPLHNVSENVLKREVFKQIK